MKHARPQRTVTISLSGRQKSDARVVYTYWCPSDGLTRTDTPVCTLYNEKGTNTLFLLDYASTLNGWTIVGIEPNPADAPVLDSIPGPANGSLLTLFPDTDRPQIFNFYIVYLNTLTEQTVRFDPQEENTPPN